MAIYELKGSLDESTAMAVDRWFEDYPECIVTLMEADGVAPRFGEPGEIEEALWTECDVSVLVNDADHDPHRLTAALNQAIGVSLTIAEVIDAEQDWQAHYRKQIEPLAFHGGLRVVPPWDAPPDPDPLTLVLEPDQAFGSGRHPTTRMCLEALCDAKGRAQPYLAGAEVLDYGCGSGILGMAAIRLGAARADGVDIDPVALECAAHNLETNALVTQMQLFLPENAPDSQYDLVIANILLNPLKSLSGLLTRRLRPGGRMLLTGLLAPQAEQCIAVYPGIPLAVTAQIGEWVMLSGTPAPAHADHLP